MGSSTQDMNTNVVLIMLLSARELVTNWFTGWSQRCTSPLRIPMNFYARDNNKNKLFKFRVLSLHMEVVGGPVECSQDSAVFLEKMSFAIVYAKK